MKKRFALLLCLTFGASALNAQEIRTDTLVPVQKKWSSVKVSHWSVALRGGVDNFLMSPDAPSYTDRINPTIGAQLEYTINPFIGYGLEYEFSDYSRPYTYLGTLGNIQGATNDALLYCSVNLSNLFSPYRDGFWQRFNVYGDLGAGAAMFKGTLDGAAGNYQTSLMGKMGLNVECSLSKLLSLSVEGRYHQYDALSMCEGSRSNRNGDALILTLGLRCKLGSGLHARNLTLRQFAPKTIPMVSKTTFVKGELPSTMARIASVEKENSAMKQQIQKLEDDAKALAAKKVALAAQKAELAAAEKAALQKKLEERDRAAAALAKRLEEKVKAEAALAKKLKELEEKAKNDSIQAAQEEAKRMEELNQLASKDSMTANKLKQMEEDLKNLANQKTGTVNLTLENVQFKSGSSILIASSFVMLDQVAGILKANSQWSTLLVSGHTDDVGPDGANLRLSQLRAAEVKKYLINKGIAASKIISVGFGESKPVATNATPEGRQQNRRVEFEIK